jgi:hypothetical protein
MEPWMAVVIMLFVVGLIGLGIVTAIKRGRSYQDKAAELGLTFQENDLDLSNQINNNLPLFSKGDSNCWYSVKGKNKYGVFHIFQYSYVHKKKFGNRNDRESVGVVFCLNSGNSDLKQKIQGDKITPFQNKWLIEYDGPWLAMKRHNDDGKKGISGVQLQSFFDEVSIIINTIL